MRILQVGPFPPPYGGVERNLVAIRTFLRNSRIPCGVINITRHRANVAEDVYQPANPLDAMRLLKETRSFDLLVDVTCVDYLNYRDAENRFGLVYLLASTATNERLTVRVYLNEPDLTVPSIHTSR